MMQTDWEAEASRLKYPNEKAMWEDLYLNQLQSLTQLSTRFGKSINNVRSRIDHFEIAKRSRGGANNVKTAVDAELIDDVVKLGVPKAAAKRGVKPQALYQRLYYKMGISVKGLKEAAQQAALASPSAVECEDVPPLSEESLPPTHGDK